MLCFSLLVLCLLGSAACFGELDFPKGFKFGAASAAYQVEGAWNVTDKGESIWDRFVHENPQAIVGNDTGDVACNSYYLWRRDIEMCDKLGLHFYRFSISWPRLLPTGFPNKISKDGLRYYKNLIDGLLEKKIEPVITLYHWDLPQRLQNLGGWTNPLISDWFADYARVVFTNFGDKVRTWITINEPLSICDFAYGSGVLAPGINDPDVGRFLCTKHVIMAHAKAWRVYDTEFRVKQDGKVSLSNVMMWLEPVTPEDEDLTELARELMAGLYSHPIYSEKGGWSPSIEKAFAEASKKYGFQVSTLPPFSEEEIKLVRGTYDFFALNYYTSRMVRKPKAGEVLKPYPLGDAPEIGAKFEKHPAWETAASAWLYVDPEGLRHQLVWLKKKYGDIKFFITENGYSSESGLDDQKRVDYLKACLKQLLLAIKEDGVDVTGYSAWTLMDNFEWMDGYSIKFGLYQVDFSSAERNRTARLSALFYKALIERQSLKNEIRDEL